MYTCPVCGYNELPHPPEDWMICPCCHTMFGYSDENWGINELRKEWIQMGAKWGSEDIPVPENWSAIKQLRNIDYVVTNNDRIAIMNALGNSVISFPLLTNAPIINVPVTVVQSVSITIHPDNQYNIERQIAPVDRHNIAWQPA